MHEIRKDMSNDMSNDELFKQMLKEPVRTEPKVKVVDAIMGSGKTSKMIEVMQNAGQEESFIYITPFLKEITRVKNALKPYRAVYEPKNFGDGKLNNLKDMVAEGKTIISTHSLFQSVDKELIELLENQGYTLILDEVMNVVEQVYIRRDDLRLLIDNDIIIVLDDGLIQWNEEKGFNDTDFSDLREKIRHNNVYIYNDTLLMWTFPVRCFKAFSEVFVLTYLFKAQIQKYYYDMYDVEYEYLSIANNADGTREIVPYELVDEDRQKYKELINIYEGKFNNIGSKKEQDLSSSWLKQNTPKKKRLITQLKRNIENYFRTWVTGGSEQNMWTTLKHSCNKLKGKGYTKGFVQHNCRATNQYSHKTNLVYAMNKYMMVNEKKFLESKGVVIDEDVWALSELLQWIWRSAIRDGKPINIYIPSQRMRNLLYMWIEGKL